MRLHWHRRDLRAVDNRGLAAPADGDGVLPVFVFDDEVLAHAAPPRVAFMLDALADLRAWYRDRGADLLIAHGDPTAVLPDLAAAYDVDGVTWCRDYTGLARQRDDAVRAALADVLPGVDSAGESAGVPPPDAEHEGESKSQRKGENEGQRKGESEGDGEWEETVETGVRTVDDAVCHPPGSIRTSAGDCYSVFTYYGRKWHDREKGDPAPAPEATALVDPAERDAASVPAIGDLGFEEPAADLPEGTRAAGMDLLSSFCASDIYRYGERRDYPADDATSRLSPHFHFGTVGIREVHAATREARADASGEAERESVREFQDQLAWREFYAQVLWANPDTVTENFQDFAEPIDWHDDPAALRAWQEGRTGYPIVDAGMRQLRDEAWMHNRVRMIVASFLTKDLLLDWRHGYRWFRERLVDHDTANDVGGWQWAASTGTDAQPYFRVFNPMTQGERYDPDGEYIRRYVPELEGVPSEVIHGWDECSPTQREASAPDYPAPIVDHAERREQAIAMFERARGE
jgi:deoxyribodipyrimidine photo-lyase